MMLEFRNSYYVHQYFKLKRITTQLIITFTFLSFNTFLLIINN